MKKILIICVLIVSIIFISGCTGTSKLKDGLHEENVPAHKIENNNIKIQNELKTPDGITVKIELAEEKEQIGENEYEYRKKVSGLLENPTNTKLQIREAGILYKYVDKYDLDKNTVWGFEPGLVTPIYLEPRRSMPLYFLGYIEDSTTEIMPYVIFGDYDTYPPCFQGDPRIYACN